MTIIFCIQYIVQYYSWDETFKIIETLNKKKQNKHFSYEKYQACESCYEQISTTRTKVQRAQSIAEQYVIAEFMVYSL